MQLVKGSKESVRLGELAQVLPRGGRSVVVVVAEREVRVNLNCVRFFP